MQLLLKIFQIYQKQDFDSCLAKSGHDHWHMHSDSPSPLLSEYLKVVIEEGRGRGIRQNPVNWLALINRFILIVYGTNYLRIHQVNFVEGNLHPFLNNLCHMVPAEFLFLISYNCICNLKLLDLKIRKGKVLL